MRTPGEPVTALTERTFTGQALDSRTGLMYYRARWYDPRLGRFIQADTVVPGAGNPQALNRYAYVVGNPVRYNDPSGHWYGPDRYDPAGIETLEEDIAFWSMAYRASGNDARSVQVDLETLRKVSQYVPEVTTPYGYNSCGLIAAAHAMGGADYLEHMRRIYEASKHTRRPYRPDEGIQPTPYVQALRMVYGEDRVTMHDSWYLGDLEVALRDGKVVIVDILVGIVRNPQGEVPTTSAPNVAHFARVLGLDWREGVIYIENTLTGGPYWQIPLTEFAQVWQYPEVRASFSVDEAEEVTQWAVVLTK